MSLRRSIGIWVQNYPITKFPNYSIALPSCNRGHYGNVITVFYGGGVLLQIADVFIVQVDIDESAELAVVVIEMTSQVGVLGDKSRKGFSDSRTFDFNRRLFPSILPQRRRNVDLWHA